MPASVAGVVPKSNGSTSTLYLKYPTRKSSTHLRANRLVEAGRQALVAHLGHAAERHQLRAAARAKGGRAIAPEVGKAVTAEERSDGG